ncbi:hypothetical protein MRS44_007056 [Fusarium solani]|uniref:uncharacterized protein n=1 Tax=Fusarium solani TaxID=169388 RepID=UPI0032C3E0B2|nr:hypothetical protein MRS44_007056 [Fusarium solani]
MRQAVIPLVYSGAGDSDEDYRDDDSDVEPAKILDQDELNLDESGKTPLYLAIAKKNINFIDVVIDEIDDLDALLGMRGEHARNCIHAAIFHHMKPESTIDLIKAASEETLRATDQSGLTPLHLAVDYKYASEPHLKIV